MKTNILKPIVIVALSVISLTIVAQNIKSTSYKQENNLLAFLESEMTTPSLEEELEMQLNKLIELCKFYPSNYEEAYLAKTSDEDVLAEIALVLEKELKFKPEESLVNSSAEMIVLNEITNELTAQVKYNPSDSMVDTEKENSEELSNVLDELYTTVKYKPTILQ